MVKLSTGTYHKLSSSKAGLNQAETGMTDLLLILDQLLESEGIVSQSPPEKTAMLPSVV